MSVLGWLDRFGGYLPAAIALLLPVVFLPGASDTYILPRASVVIGGACLGVGLALLRRGGPGLGALRLPLSAAAGAALLAFAFSISWPLSLAGSYTRYESLPMRLSYLGLLASAAWLIRTHRQRDWLVGALVFSVSVACIKAWIQWFAHVPFRPDGDLGNANLLAALIVMAAPLAVERALRNTTFVWAWAAALVILAAGLFVTTSRSGAVGVAAGALALLVFKLPRRFALPVGAVSAGAVLLGVVGLLASPLRNLNDDPPELRLHLWADGLRLIAARPVTGWGEDATGLSFGHFLSQDYASLVTFDRVHSGPLDVAATQGLLGAAALAWILVLLFRAAWTRRGDFGVAGVAAALAGYSAWVFLNFDWAPATGAFWLLAGTMWNAASPPPGDEKVRDERVREGTRPWQPAAAVALIVAAVALAVFPVLSDTWYLKGRSDLAVRYDPLQAQYHWSLGDGLIAQGNLSGGVAELRVAADYGETEPALYVELGDREAQLGNRDQARRAYQRALEIDPYYSPAAQRLTALNGQARGRTCLRRGCGDLPEVTVRVAEPAEVTAPL